MSKLLVLGAAGDMGSYALKQSIQFGIYSEITIGDINEKKALELIAEYNDPKIKFQRVNAYDHDQLVKIMGEHDVIISCIGPFYKFGPSVARAAIDAKKPLVDICDDYGPTQEILKMDEDAKKAGIPLFIGYGWTPGLSNILTKYGYQKLDQNKPIKVNISWAGGAADSQGLAVIMHVLYAVTGNIPSFLDGKLVDVPAGKGHYKVDFPNPMGKVTVFDCGHPEPVTIPKYLKGIVECTLKGGLTPNWNNKFADSLKQLHLTQGKCRADFVSKAVHATEALFAAGGVAASSARVDLFGQMNGKDVHLVYSTPSIPMGELTGYPAAIAAKLYAEGKISGAGVVPPELMEPQVFFDELKKIGIEMIYDDDGEPKQLQDSEPYTQTFLDKYGLTIGMVIVALIILGLIIWLIVWLTTL